MMKAETRAGAAAVVMLLAICSYNVLPSLKRGAYELAVVQIAFTVILAIIPFVSGWSADTRKWLTIVFMLGNGLFAYENAGHRHDGERTAHNQHGIWAAELNEKKEARKKLDGTFTPTDNSQVADAKNTADNADTDKATARASANTAKTAFAACEKRCSKLDQEAKRLEGEAKQKDADAKTAHDTLQQLSGWRKLTEDAEKLDARIDELNKNLGSEKSATDTSSTPEWRQTAEALFIAFLIELGNRFGPEAIFTFIMGLLAASSAKAVQSEPETQKAPVSALDDPTLPSPKRTTQKQKPEGKQAMSAPMSAQIIPLHKSSPDEARRLISAGKTQKEVADQLGVSDRTVRRWLSSQSGHVSARMSAL